MKKEPAHWQKLPRQKMKACVIQIVLALDDRPLAEDLLAAGEVEHHLVRVGVDDRATLLRLDAGEILSRHVRSAPRVGVRIQAARCWRRRQPCQPTLSGPSRS